MVYHLGWILAAGAGICAPALALPHPVARTFSLKSEAAETATPAPTATLVLRDHRNHHHITEEDPGDATAVFTRLMSEPARSKPQTAIPRTAAVVPTPASVVRNSSIHERSPIRWDNSHHHLILPPHYRVPFNATLATFNTTHPHHFRAPYPHCHLETEPGMDHPSRYCIYPHNQSHPFIVIPPHEKSAESEHAGAHAPAPSSALHINHTTDSRPLDKRQVKNFDWSPTHPDAAIATYLANELAAVERNYTLLTYLFFVNNTDPAQFRSYHSGTRKEHFLKRHKIEGPPADYPLFLPAIVQDPYFDTYCTVMLYENRHCWETANATRPWIFRDAIILTRKRAILNFISPLAAPYDSENEHYEDRIRYDDLNYADGGFKAGETILKHIDDDVALLRAGGWGKHLKNARRKRHWLKSWGPSKFGSVWCVAMMFEDDECAYVHGGLKWQSPQYGSLEH